MEGWCPVEDLVRWGFAHAPVVMANEAHNGLARCIRTREVGVRMIQAAHEAGVRRLAMEALPHRRGEPQGPILAVPPDTEGYLAQPEMRRLIGTALDLGWTLWAYEAVIDITPDTDQEHLRSMEFTNWREREQAVNLCRLLDAAPGEPVLVWCGNGHATKVEYEEWVPMGWHFRDMSGVDQFVIDQDVTVDFGGSRGRGCGSCWRPWLTRWPPTAAPPGSCGTRLPRRWTAGTASTRWSSRPTTR